MNIQIPGLDTEKAIANSGSEELFVALLGDVYKLIDEKSNLVESYLNARDIKNYTIQVHALKTTCRMIGATELGEKFFTLETFGKENQTELIQTLTPSVLQEFRNLKATLAPFVPASSHDKQAYDKNRVAALLQQLLTAMEEFDLGASEKAIQDLMSYQYSEELLAQIETLDRYITNLDYEEAKDLSRQLLDTLPEA